MYCTVYHKTTGEMERERDQVKGKASAQDLHVQKQAQTSIWWPVRGTPQTPSNWLLCLHARTHVPCGISKHYFGVPSLRNIWCVEDLAVSDCGQRHLGYSPRHGELVHREISDHLRVGCQWQRWFKFHVFVAHVSHISHATFGPKQQRFWDMSRFRRI